jgi:hypothetical protein
MTQERKQEANVKVFVHYPHPKGHRMPINVEAWFTRIPTVGEFVCLGTSAPWFPVLMVVHCAFEADYQAEVWLGHPSGMVEATKSIVWPIWENPPLKQDDID